MVKEQENLCKEALTETLLSEFPSSYFSFGSYKEDAVCLQYDNGHWIVYVGYRNNKDDLMSYSNIVEACIRVIHLITGENSNLIKTLSDNFFSKIVADKSA